jgi:hypothetical protein
MGPGRPTGRAHFDVMEATRHTESNRAVSHETLWTVAIGIVAGWLTKAFQGAFGAARQVGVAEQRLGALEEWREHVQTEDDMRDLRLTNIERQTDYIRGRIDEALGFRK